MRETLPPAGFRAPLQRPGQAPGGQRMRSEQGREGGKAGGLEKGAAPHGQSFLSRLGFVFRQVRSSSFCFGALTSKAPIFYSQIRSWGRAGGVVGAEVLLELEGSPVRLGFLIYLFSWSLATANTFGCLANSLHRLHLMCGVSASPHHHGNKSLCIHPRADL